MIILNKKISIVFTVVLALLVIVSANYIFRKDEAVNQNQLSQNSNSPEIVATEELASKPTVKQSPAYAGRPLDEVRFGAGFNAPGEAIEKKRGDLKVLAAILNANPKGGVGVDDWIAIGVIKKFFNDYEGARDVWEYAGVLYPKNGLSFANLGNLYGFYLGDATKAEANFLRAIENDPYQVGYYINLADFYSHVLTSKKSEVPKILLSGLELVKDSNLFLVLATYYRDIGDKANALKYYQEVLNIDPDHAGIKEEMAKLK
mgnify:CR=1 FL=1